MVYSLQKFCHYLLGGKLKFFTYHSTLKYLVNKPVLEGRICRWLLLFQEFTFEVIFKLGRLNVGPDHLSWLETGENEGSLDDQLPDADLFWVEVIPDYLADIATYLTTGQCPQHYTLIQKQHLVFHTTNYQLISRKLYKLRLDEILRRCFLDHEHEAVLWECHSGIAEGHVGVKPTARKVLQARLWWPTVHANSKSFV